MIVSIIAAMDDEGCIGRNNQLPWRLSADLQRFKALTMGHHLIMGRKTYELIGRPLPGRQSIVITRQNSYPAPGCQISASLKAAIQIAEIAGEDEAFVIGGSQIFHQALPVAERMYLTLIHSQYGCDVYFPAYDPDEWLTIETSHISDDQKFSTPYTFITLFRNSILTTNQL